MRRLVMFLAIVASACITSATAPEEQCDGRADVDDLPLVELLATHPQSGPFAIMLTGDGGWRRLDARVSDRLCADGVPVVGFLTPDFFLRRRTAEESACALERVIRFYRLHWQLHKVILIGYSRGADILPFMISRLPVDVHESISVIALLGLERTIDFKFHPSWIPFYHPKEPQFPVTPEVERLQGFRILCFYGEKEKDSLCPVLDPRLATAIREPGSHHFAGNYRAIAESILAAAK